jgi:hypothetical protein
VIAAICSMIQMMCVTDHGRAMNIAEASSLPELPMPIFAAQILARLEFRGLLQGRNNCMGANSCGCCNKVTIASMCGAP